MMAFLWQQYTRTQTYIWFLSNFVEIFPVCYAILQSLEITQDHYVYDGYMGGCRCVLDVVSTPWIRFILNISEANVKKRRCNK